jgi:hypothetical protein
MKYLEKGIEPITTKVLEKPDEIINQYISPRIK